GKSWKAVGGWLDGIYPDIEGTEEELWVASRDDDGILVHRHEDGAGTPVGPARSAETYSLMLELEVEGEFAYIAFTDRSNEGKLTVMRWSGTAWEALGGGAFSDGAAILYSMTVYDGIPYIAYSEVLEDKTSRLRVKA